MCLRGRAVLAVLALSPHESVEGHVCGGIEVTTEKESKMRIHSHGSERSKP